MIFERPLVCIDGSQAALAALRLTKRLLVPDARLLAITVAEVHYAARTGADAQAFADQIRSDAEAAAAEAEQELASTRGQARVVSGYGEATLLRAAADMDADLVAVGSHGTSRALGIALGSVATRIIHDASCSVLVARGDLPADTFPRSIVVGIDGSPESVEAEAIALSIGAAYDVCVRPLTATGGKALADDAVFTADLDARSPVDALVDASRTSDLIIVGSRGLHGMRALGSVAERVAHQASSPVLIVRGQARTGGGAQGSLRAGTAGT